ncbi:type II toxin-antitoxin system HicA family toxin [bacterium]|nr:type II toxin-antitoxin system HicA family toxin [bacterium]
MSKLMPVKPREITAVLEKLGFILIRQSGSHAVYRHPDGRWSSLVSLPIPENLDGRLRRYIFNSIRSK